jgi:cytoskeletal protein CcmA (bactofilin family)
MSTPYRAEPEPRVPAATIGKSVAVSGHISSREDLFVDGEVEGTVELPDNRITIGVNGKVKATIHAKEVIILGSVQGNVEAVEKVEIRKDARLMGDIRTARIVIEDGAVFKGNIDIVRPDVKAPPKVQAAAASASAPAVVPVAPVPQPQLAPAIAPAQQTLSPEIKR